MRRRNNPTGWEITGMVLVGLIGLNMLFAGFRRTRTETELARISESYRNRL